MKPRRKRQYKAPRVSATYPKDRLEQTVRPHGDGVFVGNYLLPGDVPTAPG